MKALHVALIVPASNTVMEPDFHRHAEATWTISTWRIFLEAVTRDAEVRMMREELTETLRRIQTTAPDLVVFGCTSAGSLVDIDPVPWQYGVHFLIVVFGLIRYWDASQVEYA